MLATAEHMCVWVRTVAQSQFVVSVGARVYGAARRQLDGRKKGSQLLADLQ